MPVVLQGWSLDERSQHLEISLECEFSGPSPDLLKQTLWVLAPTNPQVTLRHPTSERRTSTRNEDQILPGFPANLGLPVPPISKNTVSETQAHPAPGATVPQTLPAASTTSPDHTPPSPPWKGLQKALPAPPRPATPFPTLQRGLLELEPNHTTCQPESRWLPTGPRTKPKPTSLLCPPPRH